MSRKTFASSGRKAPFSATGSSSLDSTSRSSFGVFSSSISPLSYLAEPPDLAALEPHIAVSFKCLSLKKDCATKTRALAEIIAYVQDHPFVPGLGDAVLDAWVKLYPRIAIDTSSRARELSHSLQYELMLWGRKRMEKQVPKVVGTWLAGAFDSHKPASKAATNGLASFLNTPEKKASFWRKCQPQILDYAIEAAQETADTLSDDRERAAKPQEATSKFLRAVQGALGLVVQLFQLVDEERRDQFDDKYDEFLRLECIWKMASAEDTTVRKTIYQLLSICLQHKPTLIESMHSCLRRTVICDGLHSDQTGSAAYYVKTLTTLTTHYPSIWKLSEKEKRSPKKSPISLLQAFVERGSQGGTGAFWVCLDKLLSIVPQDITYDIAISFAHSLRTGVSNRLEPRANAAEGWACYIEHIKRLLRQVEPDSAKFVQECLFPITSHYTTAQTASVWATSAQLPILLRAYRASTDPNTFDALHAEWETLATTMVSRMTNSLPEQSKDHQQSQQAVAEAGERWFTLVGLILHGKISTQPVLEPSRRLISECCQILETRNFKPFGAASTLESAVRRCPRLLESAEGATIIELVRDNIDCVLRSPSSSYLFSSINAMGNPPRAGTQSFYKQAWLAIVKSIIGHGSEPGTADAIATLMCNGEQTAALARSDPELQQYIIMRCTTCSSEQPDCWRLFSAAFTFDVLTGDSLTRVARSLVDDLDREADCADALRGIEIIAQKQPALLAQDDVLHVDLITKLLGMPDTSSQRPSNIRTLLNQTTSKSNRSAAVTIIQSNLSTAGPQTLDIDTLVDQALIAAKSKTVFFESLLPDMNVWMQELGRFFQVDPNPAISVSNILGGARLLIPSCNEKGPIKTMRRDRYGASVPVRMAIYTLKLITGGLDLFSLPIESQVDVVYFLLLTKQLADEQATLMSDNMLWQTFSAPEVDSQMETYFSSLRSILTDITEHEWVRGSLMDKLVGVMVEESKELKPANLYTACALADLFQIFSSKHGVSSAIEGLILQFDLFKATPEHVLATVAVLGGFEDLLSSSKPVANFCNKMVSEMLGAKPTDEKTLLNLVLLSASASVFDAGSLPVANNRLVFAVKQITSWFSDPEQLDHAVASEACRALQKLLPCMNSVYGPYWESSIQFIAYLLERAEGDPVDIRLPYVYAALRLESMLQSLESPNDDLVDALQTSEKERALASLDLLGLPRGPFSQPQMVVESLLCRRVDRIPLKYIRDLEDIYPLIASESRDIQTAAFNLLHKALPEQQQQISVDVVLDKTNAKLPDQLLSLLLEPPTLEQYPDDALALFPISIRSYLLSWHLIFDTFSTASHKVRDDYTTHLKTRDFITPLFDFAFDVLGHSAALPLRLERDGFDSSHITAYPIQLADAESEEKNMHWLLLHIFYLALTYVPGLFKTWHINCKHRATKIAVQSWTEKYYSPLMVSKALDDVATWAKNQNVPAASSGDGEEDEKELNVRVNKMGREVVVGYEVDDVEASMSIKLAADFPLGGVSVNGLKRVVVGEKKWQSWMTITQGVIMFSNGNIVDGLTVFRKNVVGALKGHVDCAICFSIISEDNKTPEKRCATCKHMFHKYCLYKWLSSSKQNSCPLCRNPID